MNLNQALETAESTEYSCPVCDGTDLRFYAEDGGIECRYCTFYGYEEEYLPAGVLLAAMEDDDMFSDEPPDGEDDGLAFGPGEEDW